MKYIEAEIKSLEMEAIKGSFVRPKMVQILLPAKEKMPLIRSTYIYLNEGAGEQTNPVLTHLVMDWLKEVTVSPKCRSICHIYAACDYGTHYSTVHFYIQTAMQRSNIELRIFLDQWLVDDKGKLKKGNLMQRFCKHEKIKKNEKAKKSQP